MTATAMHPTALEGPALTAAIADDRRQMADLLAALAPESWDAQSLCAGWRVREVVAHITMPFRLSTPQFIAEMLKAAGNFDRMADRRAKRDTAVMSSDQLLAALRDNATYQWKPPGGGLLGALTHDVIHGLDFAVPLNIDWDLPEDRIRSVLRAVTASRSMKHFGVDLQGIQLKADDIDWSYGSGIPVIGRAQDLILVICGRKLPTGRLQGEVSERFTR